MIGRLRRCLGEYLEWYAVDTARVEGMLHPLELRDVAKHHIGGFLDWLEETGVSTCDGCECRAAFILQELRRGNFTTLPIEGQRDAS